MSVVAVGSAAVVTLPFLLAAAFVFSPLLGVLAAYSFVKVWLLTAGPFIGYTCQLMTILSRSPQQKLLQGPSSSAGRRPWQPSPGVPEKHLQEPQPALLPQPASTSMDVQRSSPLAAASEPAAGGERGPSSRAGGFGETQTRERTNLDAARRFPPSQFAVPLAAPSPAVPSPAVPSQAQPAVSGAAHSQAAAPHVTPIPPAGIRAFPSSPESVHVSGFPKARAVAGLGSMEGPRPTGLTGVARVRGIESAEAGEAGEAGEEAEIRETGGEGAEVLKANEEEMTAAGMAGQEGGKPEAEAEEKRVVNGQGGEALEEDELLVEKEVQEEGVRVASEIKKLEKFITGRTIQSPASPRLEAELLCDLVGVKTPPPLSPQPQLPRQARASRKQAAEGQLWEVRRASQLVEATKEQLGVA
ncbi:unnamed protein product [Closterium sp. Yama58-4]|nr:unnamed protein product [Closterium sp. Yama58-4]